MEVSLVSKMLLAQKHRRETAEGSLRQKTDELDRFFSVTLDLLCIANTEGYFVRLNPAWEKVLGYSRKELMANRFWSFVHPDDLAGTQEAVSRLASQRELIHFVKENARAGEVINRLRTLLKKSKTELEPVDINSVFQETISLLHSNAVIRDVKVTTELDPRISCVRGDRVQLQQVALNLILNAFEAMNERPRGEKRVLIRTWQKDAEVQAVVADSGGGLPAEETEKIFKPFYTTKPQGLGMGLSISRSIIKRHQGRIWVENNPDRGATFFLSLPVPADEGTVGRK